jgi:hypothetical protein
MLGVVKLVDPLNSSVPPVDASYQSTVVPAALDADIVTVPVPHLELPVPVGAAGTVFTVATTAVLVADIQPVVVFLVCA